MKKKLDLSYDGDPTKKAITTKLTLAKEKIQFYGKSTVVRYTATGVVGAAVGFGISYVW